jgi:single-stranded-DNA-specific exonuclease
LGGKFIKLSVTPIGGEKIVDAIYFNADVKQWPGDRCQTVYLAYRLNINEFNGIRKLQLMVEQLDALTEVENVG